MSTTSIIKEVILIIIVLSVASCNKQKEVKDLTTVRVGITTSFLGEAATFTAQEQNFYEEYGLDVTFEHNSSGGVSIRELLRGEVDIAHVAETPVVYSLLDTSYYKGSKVPAFQIFADMMYATEVQHIIARIDHGINSPGDIIGKKVAIYQDTQLDYFLDSFLLEYQIPKDSIRIVNMKPSTQFKAISRGEVDVAVTWEPYATYINQKLGENAHVLDTQLSYSTLWLATTLDRYAEEHPDVLVKYLQAIKKAQKYIEKNQKESQRLLAKETGVSIEAVKSSWRDIDYELSLSNRMITLLEDQARWLKRNNMADTTDFNFEEIVNFRPIRQVYPRGITIIH